MLRGSNKAYAEDSTPNSSVIKNIPHFFRTNVKLQFIRPHYFSHDHRFKGPPPFPKRSLIGPGGRKAKKQDVFYRLGIDPLHEASNDVLMSSFVTEMGKIKHRAETGLTTKSQRRLGKAIRRAKMMGVIPILSSARLPWN